MTSIGGFLWNAVKLAVSLAAGSLVALFVLFSPTLLDTWTLAGIGIFLLLAALPWVDWSGRPSRALGLATISISIGAFTLAFRTLAGLTAFPAVCRGRRAWLCEFLNYLHATGGNALASVPWLLFATVLLLGGIFLVSRRMPPAAK